MNFMVNDNQNEEDIDSNSENNEAHSNEQNDQKNRGISDAIKKVISVGVGAAFMTEESIRSYLSEVKLPKDVLNIILQGAGKGKEELLNRVGNEVVKIIQKIDFVKEASRFVEEHKFKVSAEVEVIRKDKSTKSE